MTPFLEHVCKIVGHTWGTFNMDTHHICSRCKLEEILIEAPDYRGGNIWYYRKYNEKEWKIKES
jgi:hypothetical protein